MVTLKTCCLHIIWEKQSNLGKNCLHPQKYALPYTFANNHKQNSTFGLLKQSVIIEIFIVMFLKVQNFRSLSTITQ